MKLTKWLVIALVGFLATSVPALAGTKVYGEGKTVDEAMAKATQHVEDAAKKAKRCVSSYPKLDTCEKLPNGNFRCHGVRANQKGSCK